MELIQRAAGPVLVLDGEASTCGILQVGFQSILIYQRADHHPHERVRCPTRRKRFERWLSAVSREAGARIAEPAGVDAQDDGTRSGRVGAAPGATGGWRGKRFDRAFAEDCGGAACFSG